MDNHQAYELYVLAKTNIQLKEASLESVHIDKIKPLQNGKYMNEIIFGKRLELINEKEIDAFLRTVVNSREEDSGDVVLKIEIIYRGRFVTKTSISKQQLEHWTDIQTVPQLLPYTRSLIASLTSHMSIAPIVLPTMDILESLKLNHENQSVGE
ncbi:preprotein translocase subunit SecB [Anoxybacillus vitaminiphilus]|uniref:Preprotein translocase subunit SecB n=1 Tax=Paranoxybacillus vitaminiphilus TaxID=581036 RepID=A0A327YH94_9BACL|nr:protein-export chaperone SecB [Anoxybacillus vitaminiphilus]RAK20350.1 preprotein translocase subunit SecB [Anoxybacillus vitaminiphilus]